MPLYVAYFRRLTAEAVGWVPVSVIVGTIAISRAWHHNYDFGFQAMLCIGFALPGFLYWRRYPRWSPGVITTVGGFLLWGSVFPVSTLTDRYAPALHINPEFWNTPKFFVALGMILTLLEDKSEFLKSAMDREHEHNRQLQKFAAITSRLLTGVDGRLDPQAHVAAADRQRRIVRRGPRPDARPCRAIDEQLAAETAHHREVESGDDQSGAHRRKRSHAILRTSWRRTRSIAHPPARNSRPRPMRLDDRASMSITWEK